MIWRGVLGKFSSYAPLGASCLAKADLNSLCRKRNLETYSAAIIRRIEAPVPTNQIKLRNEA